MISKNGFDLTIESLNRSAAEKVRLNNADYIALDNNTEYAIRLFNDRDIIADAEVYVDGELVGSWRIDAHDSITIERPGDIRRKFTFFSERSSEAFEAGVERGRDENGLIKVVFKPKKQIRYERMSPRSTGRYYASTPMAMMQSDYESGTTVLGDKSYQNFGSTRALRSDEIDWSNVTEIIVRLIARRSGYRDRPRYSRIPPRIDTYY